MSIVFEVTLDGELHQVEVTREGELIFLDYNITHDLAALEFGYPDTDATKLYAEWQKSPVSAICYNLGLDEDMLSLLAADWAEHVLPIFEHAQQKDKRPRRAIEAARDFVACKIDRTDLEEAKWAAEAAAEENAASAASWAAGAAAEASEAAAGAWAASSAGAAKEAAGAASREASREAARQASWAARWSGSAMAMDGAVAERAWQVRHFVHVMECIQTNKKWPKIKVTP